MNPMTDQQLTELRDNLRNLAVHCPVDKSNPADCPLHAIRNLDRVRRYRWFYGLGPEELIYLNSYHTVCAHIRLESQRAGLCL